MKILIVDDEPVSLAGLEALVRAEGYDSLSATSVAAARRSLADDKPAVVLADYRLEDGCGLDLAEACAESGIELVVVTGVATVETAVEALRAGAADFLTKPVDGARLKTLLQAVARSSSYRREIASLRSTLRELGRFGSMIGSSPAMQAIYDRISRVAPTDATVLVSGESGTGKELVAEAIHRLSRRAHRPFIAINCGAISAMLIESELLGHERGSFTGAERQRRGVFERAHFGTLFLDEISAMPVDLQVKLLRVLETGTFTRVGGEKPVVCDVRVVAASNRDLDAAVAEGSFRADLLYRLRVVPIDLPPLRERGGDVPALVNHFLAELGARDGRTKRLAPAALGALERYNYPGNVRELKNAIEQAYILAEETIGLEHLPDAVQRGSKPIPSAAVVGGTAPSETIAVAIAGPLADAERQLILATLEHLGGDKRRAAESLGISLKTLYSRLREYGWRRA